MIAHIQKWNKSISTMALETSDLIEKAQNYLIYSLAAYPFIREYSSN